MHVDFPSKVNPLRSRALFRNTMKRCAAESLVRIEVWAIVVEREK